MSNYTLRMIAVFSCCCVIHISSAQSDVPSSILVPSKTLPTVVEMLFPGGKSKAVILSYDDGAANDRRLVQLMNGLSLKGTFHLNSNKLGFKDYITREEIKRLYEGHEVSVHTANHPNLTAISKIDVIYEVVEDRKTLEHLTGSPVRGMAYPFGSFNDNVIEALQGLGIEYARTVEDTYALTIPDNFLKWHPTIHQFGKAYFQGNSPEIDKKELAGFYGLVNRFIKEENVSLLYVWGHSWEIGSEEKWADTEKFYKMVAGNPEIVSLTHIDLVDYIQAYRNLKFSVDHKTVINLSARDVFIRQDNKVFKIAAGTKTILN
ncbi:MAG: polysaccharide deacetylase family protein [Cyclobacteriaceae bacterium]|nr:polysaccharide deacetylase family protein [Cyclobacteriaceae bacterium]